MWSEGTLQLWAHCPSCGHRSSTCKPPCSHRGAPHNFLVSQMAWDTGPRANHVLGESLAKFSHEMAGDDFSPSNLNGQSNIILKIPRRYSPFAGQAFNL